MRKHPYDAGAAYLVSRAHGDSQKGGVGTRGLGTAFGIEQQWNTPQILVGDELLRSLSDMWHSMEMGIPHSLALVATMDRIEAELRAYLREVAADDGTPRRDIKLTCREQQILQLIYEGLRSKAIAEELSLATYTVRSHIRNASRRMGVSGAYAAACAALEQGLIRRERLPKAERRELSAQKYRTLGRKTPKIRVAG